jgi:GxxExxY protein
MRIRFRSQLLESIIEKPRIARIARIENYVQEICQIRRGRLLMLYPETSESIIGAAMTVLNELKPGLDEKIYENALVIELHFRGHKVQQQKRFPVFYRQRRIGTLIPDLIVDELVIVDPKVVSDFNDTHTAQMIGYLAITGYKLAMLFSFKEATLKWKRVVR